MWLSGSNVPGRGKNQGGRNGLQMGTHLVGSRNRKEASVAPVE